MTDVNPPSLSSASIAARLERLPTSPWHLKVRTIIGIVTFFEAFDQLLIASALPVITKEWQLTPGENTLTITSGGIGMLLGALVAGWFADRIGRVRVVVGCVALTALTSVAIVFAPNFEIFFALRFLQGVGIGGEVPIAAAFINEIAKARHRGRFVLLYELVFPAGLMAASVVAAWVIPAMGWRAMFAIGSLPIVMIVFLQRRVPESPRWLAARGRLPEADRVLTGIEQEVARSRGALPPPDLAAAEGQADRKATLRDLFTGVYLRRTIIVSAIWFIGYFINYALTAWLPTIYTSQYHLPLPVALQYNQLTNVAGFVGCVIAALTVDRLGRRFVLALGLSGAAVSLIVLALLGATTPGQVLVFASLTALFVFITNISLYLYTPELFPTRSRALGVAFGNSWNRVGVLVGPIVVGGLMASGQITAVFVVLAIVAVVGVVSALFAVETKGQTLEHLAP